ncbi:unnamed protein product [Plutella xylostella]|uniref:(diamondback moth) hypothetical protein n=1 Tax=Plutella xylostella TaxID=51655 RepID=A0A8S4EEW2_PLUXY|nr:unnamed protein product [Plutella xylostella]
MKSKMPGHAGSPYWAAVDFDSEGDEEATPPPNQRLYLDPWDNEAYGMIPMEPEAPPENFNSFAGEPVSASFYYVPTKNYDSEEENIPVKRKASLSHVEDAGPDYAVYGRKVSRAMIPEMHPDMAIYGDRMIRERRRSLYIEEPVYAPHPMLYEPLYGPMLPPPPGYLPPPPRARMSLQHHPDYAMALGYGKQRRHSRLTDAYEHLTYDSLSPDYEDWARPFPKAAPDNFHLSRYGHLQIDYSCSWNSLDRLIRHQ